MTAPAGYKLSLKLGGKPMLIKPGTYTGRVVLEVVPLTVFGGTTLHSLLRPATD